MEELSKEYGFTFEGNTNVGDPVAIIGGINKVTSQNKTGHIEYSKVPDGHYNEDHEEYKHIHDVGKIKTVNGKSTNSILRQFWNNLTGE